MPCDYRCSHEACIEEHELARTECSLGCGDPIGYDTNAGWPQDADGPAHLDCMAALEDEAEAETVPARPGAFWQDFSLYLGFPSLMFAAGLFLKVWLS